MVMRSMNAMQLEELFNQAKELGIKLVACTTSMGIRGLPKESKRRSTPVWAGVLLWLPGPQIKRQVWRPDHPAERTRRAWPGSAG